MRDLVICLTVLLAGCSSLTNQNEYPSIEKECEMSHNPDSEQCKISNRNDWTQSDKEHQMGSIYFYPNMGVLKDCDKAKYWFEKAAEKGNAKSLDGLSGLYFTGCGVKKNYKKAVEYGLLAAEKGSRHAKANLGELYREGGHGIDKDYDKAMKWYEQAITDTPARAYRGIASIYIDKEEYENAYHYIVKAANLGNTESEYNLGYMYYEGIVVDKNEAEAKIWFEKAASKGYQDAQYYLNIMNNGGAQ